MTPVSALVLLAIGKHTFWTFVRRFGSFMFIPLGLLDNSVVPLPGGMDILLIILASSHRELWWYYALMATLGSVIGGFLTYHLSAKAGKEPLNRKLGEKNARKVFDKFEKMGFWAVFLAAIAPPPVPTAAFIATAGALAYPRQRFLIALTSARLLRFALVGWVASRYGRHIFSFLSKYYRPAFWTLIGLAVAGGFVALFLYLRHRSRKRAEQQPDPQPVHKAA